jgi:uncharacterized membrane protein
MNKEQKIWLSIGIVGSVVVIGLMSIAMVSNIRHSYGFIVVLLAYCIAFVSFLMSALTEYISTRDIVSVLIRKVFGNGMIWWLK